jgi:hypothetical protein
MAKQMSYRRQPSLNRTGGGILAVGCMAQIVYAIIILAFWVAVIYVAWHFISKFW